MDQPLCGKLQTLGQKEENDEKEERMTNRARALEASAGSDTHSLGARFMAKATPIVNA